MERFLREPFFCVYSHPMTDLTRCYCGEVRVSQTHDIDHDIDYSQTGVHHQLLQPCWQRDHLGIIHRRRNLYTD